MRKTAQAFAALDITSGVLPYRKTENIEALIGELQRLNPAELLIQDDIVLPEAITRRAGIRKLRRGSLILIPRSVSRNNSPQDLAGFGCADMTLASVLLAV